MENPTNLDIACKKCLIQVLRPQLYNVIEPWMSSASAVDKSRVCQLAKIARGEVAIDDKKASVLNQFGKKTPLDYRYQALDRAQNDLYTRKCNDGDVNGKLEKRRNHFQKYVEVPSSQSVNNYYKMNNAPLKQEPWARLLNSQAQKNLEMWQNHGYHDDYKIRSQVVESLRNLDRAVEFLPNYNDVCRVAKEHGGNPLYMDSKKPQWVPPLRRVESSPAVLEPPPGVHPEVAKIKQPGGYRVQLVDHVKIQFLKNKERSMTCKVVMMGGNGAWQTSNQASFTSPPVVPKLKG